MSLRLLVIIGSTRPVRVGKPVGDWFVRRAEARSDLEVEVADLAEIDLPLLCEPKHPRLGEYELDSTWAWSAVVDRADAVVIVTPEYNYGFTAPVKNAIDHLHREWKDKPIGFVAYGGIAGGSRAVQMLKQVVTTLGMTPIFDAVYLPFVANRIGEDGTFRSDDTVDTAADMVLDELVRVGTALETLRGA